MEDAAARKARLKALRAAAEADGDRAEPAVQVAAPVEDADTAQPEEPQLKFRNYTVNQKKRLAHDQITPAQPPEFTEPAAEAPDDTQVGVTAGDGCKASPFQAWAVSAELQLWRVHRTCFAQAAARIGNHYCQQASSSAQTSPCFACCPLSTVVCGPRIH